MKLTRRAVLAGFGTALALPWLELPGVRAASAATPKRLLIFYLPNGMIMDRWTPPDVGVGWTPSPLLTPVAGWRDRMTVLSGLDNARPHEGEAHAVCSVSALSGRATSPWRVDRSAFVTMDHLAAAALAGPTAPILHLSSEGPGLCGEALSGLMPTCAPYWTTSWSDGGTPIPPEVNPRRVFDRLFAGADPAEAAEARELRLRREKSVLDFVREDAARLQAQVGREDAARVEQYFTGIRELERRLEVTPPGPGGSCDVGGQELSARYDLDSALEPEVLVEVMGELAQLALRCDHTRVVNWMLGNERSDRVYPHLGLTESHHMISHHDGRADQLEKLERVCRWEMELLDGLLAGLAATPEGETTLLDNTLVLCMTGLSEPATHSQVGLPAILAGGEVHGFAHGSHLAFEGATLAQLHLTLLRRFGVDIDSFGDDGDEELAGV